MFSSVVNKVMKVFVDTENEKLDLKMRYVDVIRGGEFIDDLIDTYIDQYPEISRFKLGKLISILFIDFINQIKSGHYNHKDAAQFLLDGKRKYLDVLDKPKVTRKEVHMVSPYTFIFEDIEEDEDDEEVEQENSDLSLSDVVYLEIIIDIRQKNRCKVFLYDIKPYLEGIDINVQDVIVIRYLNFIEQIRLEGNNSRIMKSIMKSFRNSIEA